MDAYDITEWVNHQAPPINATNLLKIENALKAVHDVLAAVTYVNNETRAGAANDYSAIEADGTLRFSGNATAWEDANVGAVSLGAGVSAPDLIEVNGSGIFARGFDGGASTEQLFASIEIPHAARNNSNISFHVHWMPSSNNNGFVKWNLTYLLLSENLAAGNGTTLSARQESAGTAWTMQRSTFANIQCSMGQQLMVRLWRNPSDATEGDNDTYPNDAVLATAGFHYEIDSVGSREIASK